MSVRYLLNGSEVQHVVRADPDKGEIEYQETHWSTGDVVCDPDGTPRTRVEHGVVEMLVEAKVMQYDATTLNHTVYPPPEQCPSCGGWACPPNKCYACIVQALVPGGAVHFFTIRPGDEEWMSLPIGTRLCVQAPRPVYVEFSNDREHVRYFFGAGLVPGSETLAMVGGLWMRVRARVQGAPVPDAVGKIGFRPPWLPPGAVMLPDCFTVRLADGTTCAEEALRRWRETPVKHAPHVLTLKNGDRHEVDVFRQLVRLPNGAVIAKEEWEERWWQPGSAA